MTAESEFDQICFSLHELQTEDPIPYVAACTYLMSQSNSLIFRAMVANKLPFLIQLLTKNSELSDKERKLTFHDHDEYQGGLDFISIEENSLEEDINATTTNIRHFSSSLLKHLATSFDSYFLNIFLSYAWKELFLGRTPEKLEVGMFLFQELEPTIYENDFKLHVYIARMLDVMNYQDLTLKITATQTLTKYVRHCKHFASSQFLDPVFQNVLPFILSQNNQVLNSGCILIIKLFDVFEDKLGQFSNSLCVHVNRAYKIRSFGDYPWLDEVKILCRRIYPNQIK